MKLNILSLLSSVAALAISASAAPQTFDFKDPKGVNNVAFNLDAPLEAISGSANGVGGTVTFDPENPSATKGKIVIASSSLHVPNPMMKEHLHSPMWMDVANYPEISFEARELKNVRSEEPNKTSAEAVGTLVLRGISKETKVPITLTYLPDKLGLRVPNMKGDLLVIRASFAISRNEFGINPKAPEDKVADKIELTVSIAGAAPRQ